MYLGIATIKFVKINFKKIWKKLLKLKRFWPLSLAKKVQVTFGAAVILILALALSILYIWMGQLTKKNLLDAGRARSQTILDRHFQLDNTGQGLVPLNRTGQVMDVNDPDIRWYTATIDPTEKIIDEIQHFLS